MDYIILRKNDLLYFEPLYKLMAEYIEETDLHRNIVTPKELVSKITKSMIDKLDENRFLQILFSEDEPIAFCYAKIDRTGDRGIIRPNWGYIMEFFVKNTYRRRGVGKELANKCEQFFREKGISNIWLTADAVTGIPFWLANDYSDTGEVSAENNLKIFTKSLRL